MQKKIKKGGPELSNHLYLLFLCRMPQLHMSCFRHSIVLWNSPNLCYTLAQWAFCYTLYQFQNNIFLAGILHHFYTKSVHEDMTYSRHLNNKFHPLHNGSQMCKVLQHNLHHILHYKDSIVLLERSNGAMATLYMIFQYKIYYKLQQSFCLDHSRFHPTHNLKYYDTTFPDKLQRIFHQSNKTLHLRNDSHTYITFRRKTQHIFRPYQDHNRTALVDSGDEIYTN